MSKDPTCGFREAALLHHEIGNDNEVLKDKNGLDIPLVDKTTGTLPPGRVRPELPLRAVPEPAARLPPREVPRLQLVHVRRAGDADHAGLPRRPDEDPDHARGTEKFHVFHLHGGGDRWRFNPVADPSYNYADTGLAQGPHHHAVTVAATRLAVDRPRRVLRPGDRGWRGRRPAVGRRLPLPLPHRQALQLRHVGGVAGLRHPATGPRADRRPARTTDRRRLPRADRARPSTARPDQGDNLDSWIRPQLPPSGVPRNGQDATVWNWKVAGTEAAPLYLGAPADPTVFPDSPKVVPGQPNLLAGRRRAHGEGPPDDPVQPASTDDRPTRCCAPRSGRDPRSPARGTPAAPTSGHRRRAKAVRDRPVGQAH